MNQVTGEVWYRDHLVNGHLSTLSNYLISKGASQVPYYSTIIDLNNSESDLKKAIRKSYTSLINWGIRELKPYVYNFQNIHWGVIKEFRELHISESGKETRTIKSWEKQYEMVKAGEAFVVVGTLKDKMVSAGFFHA